MNEDPNKQAGEPVSEGEAADTVEDRAAALEAETADLKDKLLRTLAEMENLRRRSEREVRDAGQYAIASFARDMLVVTDNLNRAMGSIPGEARQNADPAVTTFLEGVEMTEREMLKALEKHGIERLAPHGLKFDPNMHQAMFEVPDASVPNGTVVQVVQDGYRIGERVLRPALVGVSKGGPKGEAKPDKPADTPPDGAETNAQTGGGEAAREAAQPGAGVDKTA